MIADSAVRCLAVRGEGALRLMDIIIPAGDSKQGIYRVYIGK